MQELPPALVPFSAYRQFMLYKKVPSLSRPGKTDKFPVSLGGDVVDAHDSEHWVDADTACAMATVWGEPYGVAFTFTDADPFFFFDIDDCLIDGAWSPVAQMLLDRFAGAAVEVSQSGTGLHIFGAGRVTDERRAKAKAGFDLYTRGRFVALTGRQTIGSADTEHTAALEAVVAEFLQFDAGAGLVEGWTEAPRDDWRGPMTTRSCCAVC